MKVITRFAPSPTGKLHVGNTRTALINFLYAKKYNGKFILRIDDTDLARSTKEFKDAIYRDLKWLKLDWDETFEQSSRITEYEKTKDKLLAINRLYPCFETPEELEIKRKLQLAAGKPPIYDRSALKLTQTQIEDYIKQGRKPHYRFLIADELIEWEDVVKGHVRYEGKHISDPIVIREDNSMTYMLCSTVDDIDYSITHIIRGEDHVSNTAIQKQMFEALNATVPSFGHLSLVKSLDDKISKRLGGFDIESLREIENIEPMTINSFFSTIGTSRPVYPFLNIQSLTENFDIKTFSKSPTTYMPEELVRLNQKMIHSMEYEDILEHLHSIGAAYITRDFWYSVRPNLSSLNDALLWWKICHKSPEIHEEINPTLLRSAIEFFTYSTIDENILSDWTNKISNNTGLKGKELYMPLRIALTGLNSGPEMAKLLPMLGAAQVIERLQNLISR